MKHLPRQPLREARVGVGWIALIILRSNAASAGIKAGKIISTFAMWWPETKNTQSRSPKITACRQGREGENSLQRESGEKAMPAPFDKLAFKWHECYKHFGPREPFSGKIRLRLLLP
jgi:hypothetical protein